jgi:hypothetical protein
MGRSFAAIDHPQSSRYSGRSRRRSRRPGARRGSRSTRKPRRRQCEMLLLVRLAQNPPQRIRGGEGHVLHRQSAGERGGQEVHKVQGQVAGGLFLCIGCCLLDDLWETRHFSTDRRPTLRAQRTARPRDTSIFEKCNSIGSRKRFPEGASSDRLEGLAGAFIARLFAWRRKVGFGFREADAAPRHIQCSFPLNRGCCGVGTTLRRATVVYKYIQQVRRQKREKRELMKHKKQEHSGFQRGPPP